MYTFIIGHYKISFYCVSKCDQLLVYLNTEVHVYILSIECFKQILEDETFHVGKKLSYFYERYTQFEIK